MSVSRRIAFATCGGADHGGELRLGCSSAAAVGGVARSERVKSRFTADVAR
jgi:hypothetical protein